MRMMAHVKNTANRGYSMRLVRVLKDKPSYREPYLKKARCMAEFLLRVIGKGCKHHWQKRDITKCIQEKLTKGYGAQRYRSLMSDNYNGISILCMSI